MSDGVKRTVRLGSVVYPDPAGRIRRADHGCDVLVHPDDVARFDRLNVLAVPETPATEPVEATAAAEEPDRAPKRRPRRATTED